MPKIPSNRRDLITGRTFRAIAEAGQDALADQVTGAAEGEGASAATVSLATRAMATEFGLLLNAADRGALWPSSSALDIIAEVEDELTVFRPESAISRLNATAAAQPVPVSNRLWRLLLECRHLTEQTAGAFDIATDAQIRLWRDCRREERIPTDEEVAAACASSGMRHVKLDEAQRTVSFDREGLAFNLGSIGKGEALDLCSARLQNPHDPADESDASDDPSRAAARPLTDFCLYGGHSSIIARGQCGQADGWPVGIGNPLFTSRRLGTLMLKDRALATSGSNVQFYRHRGRRYGHILDPRSGWPASGVLSVMVLAETAARADALATAFFVLGVEKSLQVCDNDPSIGMLLIPPPDRGGRPRPVFRGIPDDIVFLDRDQIGDPE